MQPQLTDWTCSACSLDWTLRATALDPNSTRPKTIAYIGYPDQINPTYGLMDGSGSALQGVLNQYGQASLHDWLDFDAVYALAQQTTGMMSGMAWYHWVALRGVQGSNLWIANSAPGYKGVWDTLSREDFARLGPFSVVWLTED
jgi:hypothetical protein